MKCRHCNQELKTEFVDLIASPPSNSFLSQEQLNEPETYFPLKIFTCEKCFLVQVDEYKKSDEIFDSEYVYFSSYSTSWLQHAKKYVEMITKRLSLNENSYVVEIASNDGYLLKNFVEEKIPCLGVEPTNSTARVAREKGIDVLEDFFGEQTAKTLKKADLILGNNVLAHVPDINDFVNGLKIALKKTGTVTMEFPHVLELIQNVQFDTIYHEHFSYLSLYTVQKIFSEAGLRVYDVETLTTHGGSLRIYACHEEAEYLQSQNVLDILEKEKMFGLQEISFYQTFQKNVNRVKNEFVNFLIHAYSEGKKVVAYGAAAKGNTFLNYAGIKKDLIEYVVDKSPHKQGKFLPGSHIEVVTEEMLQISKPDYIVILPWNIKEEVEKQLAYTKEWDCKFVVAIPKLKVF